MASAQTVPELTFSIDLSGPTIGSQAGGTPTLITDADLLGRSGSPFDPGAPRITLLADFLDRYSACAPHVPGVSCGLEVNAISFGRDAQLRLNPGYEFHVLFTVDEFARGRPPAAGYPYTDVFLEAQLREAAGDMFYSTFQGVGPFQASPNAAYADANGRRAQQGVPHVFGLGLAEPIQPSVGTVDSGDNLDAINYGTRFDPAADQLYFSLEGGIGRCNEQGVVFDSAGAQTLVGTTINARAADVLLFVPGGGVRAFARGQQLGLDMMGPGTDDIDALMVFDNGNNVYDPPANLYDWAGTAGSDLILFSVRCGSSIVGVLDPVTNRVIGEGDVLIKLANSPVPQVFIPAEALGLRSTEAGDSENDELNGLDIFDDDDEPFLDCNLNGIDDTLDISYMNSQDVDTNGIPDECEDDWSSVCDCSAAADAPCGNTAAVGAGCRNQTGVGGRLEGGGTTSVDSDALELVVSDLLPGSLAIGFGGLSITGGAASFNGRRCIVPSGPRLAHQFAGAGGGFIQGPGLIAGHPMTITVLSGSTFYFQYVYRDSPGPCAGSGNWTNALRVLFTP